MQIIIDSNDSLDDVLRVIGASYRVTLAVAESPSTVRTTSRTSSRKSTSSSRAERAPRRKGSPRRESTARVDASAIRAWARENGHDVSGRGPLPAAIVDAYHVAR